MLDFVREVTQDPWGRAVYHGFRSMCNDDDGDD